MNSAQKAFVRHLVACEMAKAQGQDKPMSDREFIQVLGYHYNTAGNWKKLPEVQAAFKRALKEIETSRDYFMLCMKQKAREEMWANYEKSKGNDKRQYLKMIMDETAEVPDYEDTVDYEDMTDEDLANLCMKRDVSVLGMTQGELLRIARGSDEGSPGRGERDDSASRDDGGHETESDASG